MTPLCRLEEIEDRHAKSFVAELEGEKISLFVVRKGDKAFAYVNSCPHTGAPLDWQEDGFLDLFRVDILCSLHGARFVIDNGYCYAGPCKGRGLTPLPLELVDGLICLV
jgi:nitrite reductase/ring-hydroxylating ferredoxin subunit